MLLDLPGKLFDRQDHWVLHLSAWEGSTVTKEQLERDFIDRILPAIGARAVRETEGVY